MMMKRLCAIAAVVGYHLWTAIIFAIVMLSLLTRLNAVLDDS